ncbi:peptide-methionine (S)-S-oxide reductase MsrA [Daejeonella sp.]|uniref:peptide-methionine (S)-S-oxide reductase MsrA n=1 Tax=Daejeonella sp. TaxID=2805397 RepID=UPI00398379C7
MEQATFGGGCFWCTEAVFQNLRGVTKVVSGYMGGQTENPTYKEICNGHTGHVEIIQIEFNEEEISFEDLLLIFFKTHDPTTLNRQGNDAGTQYRSAIFYETAEQKVAAESMIDKLEKEMVFDRPIVTEITPISKFYSAEDYHQNYFNNNPDQGYCAYVIQPKLAKFTREFGNRIK